MKPILKIKIAVDAAMTLALLLLMAYGLVGVAAHEWIGMGLFVLMGLCLRTRMPGKPLRMPGKRG